MPHRDSHARPTVRILDRDQMSRSGRVNQPNPTIHAGHRLGRHATCAAACEPIAVRIGIRDRRAAGPWRRVRPIAADDSDQMRRPVQQPNRHETPIDPYAHGLIGPHRSPGRRAQRHHRTPSPRRQLRRRRPTLFIGLQLQNPQSRPRLNRRQPQQARQHRRPRRLNDHHHTPAPSTETPPTATAGPTRAGLDNASRSARTVRTSTTTCAWRMSKEVGCRR